MKWNEIQTPAFFKQAILPSVDGLRAISILLVIAGHVFFANPFIYDLELGRVGVEIFFVISGFLITTLLLKEKLQTGSIHLGYFYIRRSLRILPLVFLYLFVLFFLNKIFSLAISNANFLASLFFVKNLPIITGDWYTGHLWSLGIEEQYYLLFPFLLSKLSLKNYTQLIIFLIFSITLISFLGYNNIGVFQSNRNIHLIAFAIINVFGGGTVFILVGSLISILAFKFPNTIVKYFNQYYLAFIVFFIAIILRCKVSLWFIPFISPLIFAFLIGVILLLNLNAQTFYAQFLNLKWMRTLGVLSYSLYIWQQLFTHFQPWQFNFGFALNTSLNLALLIVVAYVSYEFYESRITRLKNRFLIS